MDNVVHFEIPADDMKRAQEFYKSVFGWNVQSMPEMNYTILQASEMDENKRPKSGINGGMMKRSKDVSAPVVYMYVKDIDDTLKRVQEQGGKVVQGKTHVQGEMYTSYFKDCEGNVMGLVQGMM